MLISKIFLRETRLGEHQKDMATLGHIASVVLSLVLLQGVSGQKFYFPNPVAFESVTSDAECGMTNLEGSWTVEGTLRVKREALRDCDKVVNVGTAYGEICSIDLTACGTYTDDGTVDACYCTETDSGDYKLNVRREPRVAESGLMLQATIQSRDIMNPQPVVQDIGTLPIVHEDVLTTYQMDDGEAQPLMADQVVYRADKSVMTLEFCATNVFVGSEVAISLKGHETKTRTSGCVHVMAYFDFSVTPVYTMTLSYEETRGCRRVGSFSIKFMIQPEGCEIAWGPRQVVALDSELSVMCDKTTDQGGWIVFQRRTVGDVDFYIGWQDYKDGFGNLNSLGDFWLGLEHIHSLTTQGTTYELRIDMGYKGECYNAKYESFSVSGELDNYRLHVSGYSGTAGDALILLHNGQPFTTLDKDNDARGSASCAQLWHGAWWYKACHRAHLNGLWASTEKSKGLIWRDVTGWSDSVTFSEMKMRPLTGLNKCK